MFSIRMRYQSITTTGGDIRGRSDGYHNNSKSIYLGISVLPLCIEWTSSDPPTRYTNGVEHLLN
jgi:hypothetical protein